MLSSASTPLGRRNKSKTIADLRPFTQSVATDRNATQAQVALNWCRSHDAIPLVGLRTPKQAKDAGEASKWNLNKKEKESLDLLRNKCKIRMPNNPFQSD